MSKPWKVRCTDTGDGSGDGVVILPTALLAQIGLQIGDELSIEVSDEVIVLQPMLRSSTAHSMTEILRIDLHRIYRRHLEDYLHIPIGDPDRTIHERIKSGFPASLLQALLEQGVFPLSELNRIIPSRTLKSRLAKNQLLKSSESDQVYRIVHIVALAVAVFSDSEKANRWLTKPKSNLSGASPFEVLSTTSGLRQVEEMLIQIAEGLYN
ncbi:antitoxin Xre/MbcA/ParS toxin-binding domain-containing protein [Pseudomonas sp. IT-P395]|uniref:antitoxin Xre/MbcA/ParS toxin-binding domain-containing protein n=1 Tax=Pseudomonas sp. IT-P395 TaxID=3026459 RepID=UPI0039E0BF53